MFSPSSSWLSEYMFLSFYAYKGYSSNFVLLSENTVYRISVLKKCIEIYFMTQHIVHFCPCSVFEKMVFFAVLGSGILNSSVVPPSPAKAVWGGHDHVRFSSPAEGSIVDRSPNCYESGSTNTLVLRPLFPWAVPST